LVLKYNAGGAFTLKHSTILELPFKIASNQKVFINKVDEILDIKSQGKNITALEQQIDNLDYSLYDLTYDEVKVVDPEFGLSREEYEGLVLGCAI
jgi:adenine-specific DNA-methyltransferase